MKGFFEKTLMNKQEFFTSYNMQKIGREVCESFPSCF
jgi:hypothetical protein